MHTRLFLLTCGTADLDQSTLTPGRGARARGRVPIPAYLLQTDGRTILFDTSMPYTGRMPKRSIVLCWVFSPGEIDMRRLEFSRWLVDVRPPCWRQA